MNHFFKNFGKGPILILLLILGLTVQLYKSWDEAQIKARDVKRLSDIFLIQTGLKLYFENCNEYPKTVSLEVGGDHCPANKTLGAFLRSIPTAPSGCITAQSDNNSASYVYVATLTNYSIYFCTEKDVPGSPIVSGGSNHVATPLTLSN